MLLYPQQPLAIDQAVRELLTELHPLQGALGASRADEMVHLTDLPDGSGTVRVELTESGKRWVTKGGVIYTERPRD